MKLYKWLPVTLLSFMAFSTCQVVAQEADTQKSTNTTATNNTNNTSSSEKCPQCPECLIYASELTKAQYNNAYLVMDIRFSNAVKDAMTIEPEELLPLVSLERTSPFVSYDDNNRVLLLTLHSYPDSYPDGKEMQLQYQCWGVTDKEFKYWLGRNSTGVTDWTLRLNQLLGMPANRKSTHMTAMWASPEDVLRPAYRTDVFNPEPAASFDEAKELVAGIQVQSFLQAKAKELALAESKELKQKNGKAQNNNIIDLDIPNLNNIRIDTQKHLAQERIKTTYHTHSLDSFQSWFNKNIIASYFSQNDYPWTRIGYTYDWANALRSDGNNGASEYGLSEFLIPQQTNVKIEYTLSVDAFMTKMLKEVEEEKVNSTTNYFLQ